MTRSFPTEYFTACCQLLQKMLLLLAGGEKFNGNITDSGAFVNGFIILNRSQ